MKVTLILALCVALASAADFSLRGVNDALTAMGKFKQFTKKFGRTYTGEEWNQRFSQWVDNALIVEKHNAEAAAGKHSFTLSVDETPFADMSNEEYRTTVLGKKGSVNLESASGVFDPPAADPPATWDWRDTPNIVGDPKNQGQCGSCWAFSAVASMEGAYNQKTNKIHSFSEQQLVDCVDGGKDTCQIGGEMFMGVADVVARGGIESESDYPYKGTSGGGCNFDKSKVVTTFSGYTNITSGDEAALTSAAYNKPIISVGIDASSIMFQLYFGGVYDQSGCKTAAEDLDHGVAVVGYGTSSGKDFYWVRNSWGGSWGLKGYIMMSRNKNNQCGIATQAMFANL